MLQSSTKDFIQLPETITSNKIAYSVQEVSNQTSLSKGFLRKEISAGKLRVVRPGNSKRILILSEDLRDYLNKGESKNEK